MAPRKPAAKEVAASDRGSADASPAMVPGGSATPATQPASDESAEKVSATGASVDAVAQSAENVAGVAPHGTLLDNDAPDEAAADVSAPPIQEMAAPDCDSADAHLAAPAGGSAVADIQQSGDDAPLQQLKVSEVDMEVVPEQTAEAATPRGTPVGKRATDDPAVATACDSGSAGASQTDAASEPDEAGPNADSMPDTTHLEADTGANDVVMPASTNEARASAEEQTEPTEAVLVEHIRVILAGTDLESTSMRALRGELEQRLGLGAGALDAHRDQIIELVQAEIGRIQKVLGTPARRPGRSKGGAEEPRSSRKRRRQGPEDEDRVAKDSQQIPAESSAAPAGLTKADFLKKEWRLSVNVGGKKLKLPTKAFQSGGLGFYITDQVEVEYEGKPMTLQCQINCAVIGSKTWEA